MDHPHTISAAVNWKPYRIRKYNPIKKAETMRKKFRLLISFMILLPVSALCPAADESYDNFNVAVYIPVSVVLRFEDPDIDLVNF